MIRQNSFTIFLILLILLPCISHAQRSESALAVVSDVRGNVTLKRPQTDEDLKVFFGMQLIKGDQLKTGRRDSVSILFLNGNLIRLGGGSSITISGNQFDGQSGNIGAGLAASFSNLVFRQDKRGEMGVLIDLRSDDGEYSIIPVTPCNTLIVSNKPELVWVSDSPAEEFVVRLYNSQGLVWEKRTTDTSLKYPEAEPPLEFGESYFWNVEGEELINSFKSQNLKFTILPEEKLNEMRSEEQRLRKLFEDDRSGSCFHSIMGTFYASFGLYEDAISEFEQVREMNPEAPLPYEILGGLYSDVGKKDMAIEALQKAIDLEKKNRNPNIPD